MKISSAKLKQIIKEEIEALGEMDVSSAEDYRQKIEGFAEMVRMVSIGRMPEMLKKSLEDSVKFSVEDVLNHISDDNVRDGVEEMVVDLLGQEYLPQSMGNMNESVGRFKQIIKEEIERFLEEQSAVTIDFEGTTTSIEFLGMETKYDQTETKLRINGEEYSFGAYDVDDLADDVIVRLGDNDDDYYYWFLGDYADEEQVSQFKEKIEDALEGMGADPERESKTRASYSPENVYD
jgi:Sec-independent protein translocase protein TatA